MPYLPPFHFPERTAECAQFPFFIWISLRGGKNNEQRLHSCLMIHIFQAKSLY